MNSTFDEGFACLQSLMTDSAVFLSLAPMMMEHPSEARYLTVSAPMPELPPVTTAYFLVRSRGF